MRNLYFEPEHAETVREIERELMDWLITSARPATVWPPVHWESDQAETVYGQTVNPDGKLDPRRIRALRGKNYL